MIVIPTGDEADRSAARKDFFSSEKKGFLVADRSTLTLLGIIVPFYQYDRGIGRFDVLVTGAERVAAPGDIVEAWVVHAGARCGEMLDYLISRDNRREPGYCAGYQALSGNCSRLD